MLAISAFLILIALILLWKARQRHKSTGLPVGRIIYADTRAWGPVEEPLYAADLGLAGRPDYLVQQKDQLIPVEVKSSRVAEAPYDAHIFQLAAYCLLVERAYGKRPDYGILHYPNRTIAVDFTPELETALLDLLEEIRELDRRKEVDRSHEAPGRCKGCGYRTICDQRITGS